MFWHTGRRFKIRIADSGTIEPFAHIECDLWFASAQLNFYQLTIAQMHYKS